MSRRVSPLPPPPSDTPSGIYLHFPFCAIRCTYCDFATVAGQDARIPRYLDALEREILTFQQGLPPRVDTVFFGGGTPSRLLPDQVRRLLGAIAKRFDLLPGAEVTLEGNPESLGADRLGGFRQAGVTRISVGMQSLDDEVLRGVGRAHDGARARRAVREAVAGGFASVNVDLIAGLPGERLALWDSTLEEVADLGPAHVSVYLLETDKDAPLARSVRRGKTAVADDDELAATYLRTTALLASRGMEHYEISNFARAGHRSRHNSKYWTDAPYAGFGLGAHAYFAGQRRANRRDLEGYLADVQDGRDPLSFSDPWDPRRRLDEALMLGLRLCEGVDLRRLGERYGLDPEKLHAAAWERAEAAGVIDRRGARVRLTPWGRLRSNELFADLIGT